MANKAELLFALSLFNAFFAVSQAWRSWAIHEIGRYCYEFLGLRITRLTSSPFAVWDEWRRGGSGAPQLDRVRSWFWYIETCRSIAVSAALVWIGARQGGLVGAYWFGAVAGTVILNLLIFAYVIAAPNSEREAVADLGRKSR